MVDIALGLIPLDISYVRPPVRDDDRQQAADARTRQGGLRGSVAGHIHLVDAEDPGEDRGDRPSIIVPVERAHAYLPVREHHVDVLGITQRDGLRHHLVVRRVLLRQQSGVLVLGRRIGVRDEDEGGRSGQRGRIRNALRLRPGRDELTQIDGQRHHAEHDEYAHGYEGRRGALFVSEDPSNSTHRLPLHNKQKQKTPPTVAEHGERRTPRTAYYRSSSYQLIDPASDSLYRHRARPEIAVTNAYKALLICKICAAWTRIPEPTDCGLVAAGEAHA